MNVVMLLLAVTIINSVTYSGVWADLHISLKYVHCPTKVLGLNPDLWALSLASGVFYTIWFD